MKYLSLNEEAVLLAVLKLKGNAYPVTVRELVNGMTGKEMVYGTLYNTLEHLVKKGYVTSEKGEPTRERGGKGKVFFHLTRHGVAALDLTRRVRRGMWEGIGELKPDTEGS